MQKWKLPSQSQDPLFQRSYLKPLFIQARCPGCNKLYRIDTRDLKSSSPRFDCSDCKTSFTLSFDENDKRKVKTKTLGALNFSSASQLNFQEKAEGLRKCPKCQNFSPRLAAECPSCGVIFSKLDELPMDPRTGALPSLVKAWQDLMQDYSNVTKHLAFVNQCEDLQAVPFALKKYKDLKEAQPHDDLAQQMFHRVLIRSFAKKTEFLTGNKPALFLRDRLTELRGQINWSRCLRISPLVVSGLLILIGISKSELRNLIGIGASILFISFGLALITKGRIRWSDFWD